MRYLAMCLLLVGCTSKNPVKVHYEINIGGSTYVCNRQVYYSGTYDLRDCHSWNTGEKTGDITSAVNFITVEDK